MLPAVFSLLYLCKRPEWQIAGLLEPEEKLMHQTHVLFQSFKTNGRQQVPQSQRDYQTLTED